MSNQNEKTHQENVCAEQEMQKSSITPLRVIQIIDTRTQPETRTESMLFAIKTYGKNATDIVSNITSPNLADKKSFKQAICALTANINLDIKEKEFTKIRESWYEKADSKTVYVCAGTQNRKHIWANAFHDLDLGQTVICPKIDDTKDYDCVENSMVDMRNSCRPILYPATEHWMVIFKQFFHTLCMTYKDSSVLICFGMALAVIFWDIFQKETEGFPAVFFTGEHHAGKSTLLMLIAAIFGIVDVKQLTGGNSTPNAIHHILSSRMNIPVLLEELHPKVIAQAEELVKSVYVGLSRFRGKKNGIEEIKIFTSFVSTSNDFFKKLSGQLLSRIVFATMKKGQFNFEKFPYFDMEKRKELSQILPIFLRFRPKIMPVYRHVYAELDKIISEKGRHISNLAISCTVWYIVNAIMGYELVNWHKIAIDYNAMYQSYLNTEVKSSDIILNDITRLIEADKLDYGQDYKLVHGTILRLNLNRYIEKFNVANPQNMMSPAQFRLLVANDKRFDTKTVVMKGLNRAISIDVSGNDYLLEEIETQKNCWLANPVNRGNDED